MKSCPLDWVMILTVADLAVGVGVVGLVADLGSVADLAVED